MLALFKVCGLILQMRTLTYTSWKKHPTLVYPDTPSLPGSELDFADALDTPTIPSAPSTAPQMLRLFVQSLGLGQVLAAQRLFLSSEKQPGAASVPHLELSLPHQGT